MKKRKREVFKTGIVKISSPNLVITTIREISGKILNQFSLDEYNENLRVAVTIDDWFTGTSNDVYVLDKDLKIIGAIKDLGITERIYSVRFIEDKGYLVTFRETDPFYVLDLSNPRKPELKSELKIPGYSSYLHPLEKNKI